MSTQTEVASPDTSVPASVSASAGGIGPFSEAQIKVLAAGANAVVSRHSEEEVERILSKLPADAPHWQREAAAKYARMEYTDFPKSIEYLVEQMLKSFSAPNVKQLQQILTLLSTRAGTLLLTGHVTAFADLTSQQRQAVIGSWSRSMIPDMRKLAKTFIAVPLFALFNTNELAATACGYPFWGDPHLDDRQDLIKKPYEYKFESIVDDFQVIDTDVLVVGSGCGGGVVAAEVSQAGHRVLVVEQGYHENPSKERSVGQHAFRDKFAAGGIAVCEEGTTAVMAAQTFGGGSTVNWAASLRPPHTLRQQWAKQFGLPHFITNEFSESIEAVCRRMGVSHEHTKHSVANAKLIEGSRKLGITVDEINTGGNTHDCGYCGFGCPYNEKQGGVVTWLRDTAEAGGKFIQRCRVERLLFTDPKKPAIPTKQTLDQFTPTNARTQCVGALLKDSESGRLAIVNAAKSVVVSGGSVFSPALLLRSGLKNSNIGRDLHLHPCCFVTAVFDEETRPFEGAIMTAVSNSVANKDGTNYGCKLEVMFSAPQLYNATMNGWRGSEEHKSWALQYRHSISFIMLSRDRDGGRVTIDENGDPRISYYLSKYDSKSVLAGIIAGAEVMIAAGAKAIFTGQPLIEPYIVAPGHKGLADPAWLAWVQKVEKAGIQVMGNAIGSAHQMSSNKMGTSPKISVVNPRGQVWNTENLWIADASVLPTSSGVNPMITTMSTAHSIAQFIKSDLAAPSVQQARL